MEPEAPEHRVPGQVAVELLKEFKRTEGSLVAFQEDKRRQVCEEIQMLYHQSQRLGDESVNEGQRVMMQQGVARNKRCMLAYLNARLNQIQKLRWDVGVLSLDLSEKLTPQERKFYDDYSSILANYMGSQGLDLTTNFMTPPSHLVIEVQVLVTVGQVSLPSDGSSVLFEKDKRIFMNRLDAEPFIRQGILEHIA